MVNVRVTVWTVPPSLSFSAVPQEDLNAMVADYLALDGIRVIRRLFVVRFGLLALVAAVGRLAASWPVAVRPLVPRAAVPDSAAVGVDRRNSPSFTARPQKVVKSS
jgi:hypothetical protein